MRSLLRLRLRAHTLLWRVRKLANAARPYFRKVIARNHRGWPIDKGINHLADSVAHVAGALHVAQRSVGAGDEICPKDKQQSHSTPISAPRFEINLVRDWKRVLMIEARMITPDQDSGSVRTEAILRLLRELGCIVEFISDDMQSVQPYSERLQQMGVQVWNTPSVASVQELINSRGLLYDYIMLCRHAVAARHIEAARMRAPQAKILFDTVDLHYLREERRAQLEGTDARRKIAAETRRQELSVVRKSDVTIVVSAEERAELTRAVPGARVEVLSNIYEVQAEETASFEARQGILFVGGFKHHPNVDGVQWFIREIWPLVRSSLPEAVVDIVGSHMPAHLRALEAPGAIMRGFIEDLEPLLKAVRISVAPLRYGAGVKGKINQAMAWGVPVVATPVAVEGMSLRDGVDVLVATDARAFSDAVVRLYEDERLWNRLAEAGRENIRRNFSPEVAMRSLKSVLRTAHDDHIVPRLSSAPAAVSPPVSDTSPTERKESRAEIGWKQEEIEGKTVLTIGGTPRELLVQAARLGADRVAACEIRDHAEALRIIASREGLPIFILDKTHAELDPATDSAAVVLAWQEVNISTLDQRVLKRTIRRMASLTNEVLYLKAPRAWADATKPEIVSIQGAALGAALEELKYYFDEVTILPGTNWVVIRASGLRPNGAILSAIGNAKPLGISLRPATNPVDLVESDRGPLVAKMMGARSSLAKLETSLLNRLCDELNASEPECLIAPLKLEEGYRIEYRGRYFMVFPFAGDIADLGRDIRIMCQDEVVQAFIRVRRDLRKLPATVICELRKAKFFVPTKNSNQLLKGKPFLTNHMKGLENRLEKLLSLLETAEEADFDAVSHCDLQIVNLIFDKDNKVRCVDLDNMALATVYTDILTALAWQGSGQHQFGEVCSLLQKEEFRQLRPMDIAMAVGSLVRWRLAVEKFSHVRGVRQTVHRWEEGLRNLVSWGG